MKVNLLRKKAKPVLTKMKSFGYLMITCDPAFLRINEISRNRAHVNENANMQAVAKILRARASEHPCNFCAKRPNFASTFKLNGTIRYPQLCPCSALTFWYNWKHPGWMSHNFLGPWFSTSLWRNFYFYFCIRNISLIFTSIATKSFQNPRHNFVLLQPWIYFAVKERIKILIRHSVICLKCFSFW